MMGPIAHTASAVTPPEGAGSIPRAGPSTTAHARRRSLDVVRCHDITLTDRIAAMRNQESSPAYACRRSLPDSPPAGRDDDGTTSASVSSAPVDAACRSKMVEWTLSLVAYCGLQRETAFVASVFVDRYLSSVDPSTLNRRAYQLLSMTALHVAVKVHERSQMDASLLSQLSRGEYSPTEFVEAENRILEVLGWRLSGPSVMDFVRAYLSLLLGRDDGSSASVPGHSALMRLEECARLQVELAASDNDFVGLRPSTVAAAAVLNAVGGMDVESFPLSGRERFASDLEASSEGGPSDPKTTSGEIRDARTWLRDAVSRTGSPEFARAVCEGGCSPETTASTTRRTATPVASSSSMTKSVSSDSLASKSSSSSSCAATDGRPKIRHSSPMCISKVSQSNKRRLR